VGRALPNSRLFCHEDLCQRDAASPHVAKPIDDECLAVQRRLKSECHDDDDTNTRRVLRSMMAQEHELRCGPLVGDLHRFGASIVVMVLNEYRIKIISHTFGSAINLLHRALALPRFRDQAGLDPALPLACCSLGIKWECAAPTVPKDMCRIAGKMGMVVADQALVQMELSLVEALNWSIDAVTPSHLLANILLLSHPPMPHLQTSAEFMLKVYYTYVAPHAMHLPSTVVRSMLAAVAGIAPPPPVDTAEPSDHADYRRILALLLQHTEGRNIAPLSASRGMHAMEKQALRHEWLAWLPEGLRPLGGAQLLSK